MRLLCAGEQSTPCGWRSRRFTLLVLLGIVAIGCLLRFYDIGSHGFWIDEAFSIWLAEHPLPEMIHWVQDVDHHPPLYYALLRGWTTMLSVGEWSASLTASPRALSALFGGLVIPVVYLLGRLLVDDQVGLVSALILALSPFHIRFAQEARMYTLLTLLASLAIWSFIRLYEGWTRADFQAPVRSPNGTKSATVSGLPRTFPLPWIGYVVFTAAMLWTHNTAVFFPLAANLMVLSTALIRHRSRLSRARHGAAGAGVRACRGTPWLRRWFWAQVAVLLLWLPWVPSFVSQAADVYRRFWLPAPRLGSVLSVIGAFLCEAPSWPFPFVAVVDVALAALAVVGLREFQRRAGQGVLLATVFLTPFAGQWFVSLWRPILYARTLIWTSIPLYLMVGAGVCSLGDAVFSSAISRQVVVVALVALVAVNGAALYRYYGAAEKEAWDDAAALVAERVQHGDLLLFNDAWGQIPFDYYFHQLYNPHLTASRMNAREGAAVVEHGLPVDLFDRGVLEPEMREQDLPRLRALVDGHQRVWLIYSHQWYTDPEGLIPPALATTFDLRQRWTFEGLQVRLYVAD